MPLAIDGLVFAALIVLMQRHAPLVHALVGDLFLLCVDVVGLILLIPWILTAHHYSWTNANLQLFNPLPFTLMRSPRGLAAF